jgi:uncharacterized membrane protein
MHSLYNRVAGQSIERLAALSDGIFAVAMTLLVLDLRVPAREAIHSEHDLWHTLLGLALLWSWSYATRAHFLAHDAPAEIHPAVVRGIVIAQSLYAAGAALCVFNTYYSIAAIVLVQLNYAIAPQFCWGLFSRSAKD